MFNIQRNNITITKGDDVTFKATLYDIVGEIEEVNGTMVMTVDDLFSVESTDGKFAIGHALTEDEDFGIYPYDIQYTNASGHINTIAKGLFIIEGDVTENG